MQELKREFIEQKFETLKNLEAEHGKLTAIQVEDKIALFKKPSRQVLKMATAISATDPMGYLEKIAENCYVAGDRELLDDDEYFLAIVPVLNELVQTKTASLLKL